jgi:glyoxylase-like metal-dependent hydrolase (beta-lactamase superfamily II)
MLNRSGSWVGTLGAAVFLVSGLEAQNFDTVQVRSTTLAPGLAMLTGAGGNLAVAWGDDATFLVDDQYAPLTPKIVAAIGTLTAKPVRFVVNTHWHDDHTGGNENMGKAGALLVAHENVRARMSTDQFLEALQRSVPASPKGALPVVTFTDQVTFHLNGEEIHAVHVPPAHTDGDAIVHFTRANVLHMGDLFFNGMYPFVDLSSGGSLDGIISAAGRALGMVNAETRIIPGHGPLASAADLRRYQEVLMAVRDRVKKLIAEGKTVDQVIAAKPLADFDPVWGRGFMQPDVFLRIVSADLSKRR